jgi:serine/threonine protein kinase
VKWKVGQIVEDAAAQGPWRIEADWGEGPYCHRWEVRSTSEDLRGLRGVMKVPRYEVARREDHGYVAGVRGRLRFELDTLTHVSCRLPEPLDFFALCGGEAALVRSLVHGRSVASLIRAGRGVSVDPEGALILVARVCDFLSELHAGGGGWLFGALTPEHIIVSEQRGLEPSFVGTANFRMLRDGAAVGEEPLGVHRAWGPGYAAPEVLAGRPVGPRADLYAVGALLFHLYNGVDPRVMGDEILLARAEHLPTHDDLASVLLADVESQCRRGLRGLGVHRTRVRQLIVRAMDPDPEGRFTCASEMRSEILKTLGRTRPLAWSESLSA